MAIRMNAAPRRLLAASALAGLIALAAVPGAMAQWLPPWRVFASPGDIAGQLEAQGYVLIAPLQRRPGVYLADVRAGPAGYQRLVIDDRNGEILERFSSSPRGFGYPPRRFGPEFAGRYDGVPDRPPPGVVQPPPGPGYPDSPNGGPTNARIPSAISPFASPLAPLSAKPKSAAIARKMPSAKTAPPMVSPPLPPPAPREAAKPEEAPPAPTPAPKIESPPGESENASAASAPAAPEASRGPPRPSRRPSSNRSLSGAATAGPDRAHPIRRGERPVEGQYRSAGPVRIDEKGRPIGRPRFTRDPRRSAYAACAVGALTASIVLPPLLIAMVRGF